MFVKSLSAFLPASNCFLDKEELQPLCSFVNLTNKSISKDFLDAKTTIVKSIVSSASWCAFEWKHPYEFGPVLKWSWTYKAAFPIIYLLLSAGLTIGVSTTTCEASFFRVVKMLTSHRRCMTHDCKYQLVVLGFEKNETASVANEGIISEVSTKTRRLHILKYSLKLTLPVPSPFKSRTGHFFDPTFAVL